MSKRKILITAALPYANGSIHLGHLVEYIQADIWVRFQKMCLPKEDGHEIYFVCADDAHGTPVMLRAERERTTPEKLINQVHNEHLNDFTNFHIKFDNYYTTHSPETRKYSEEIYKKLKTVDPSLITTKSIEQFYDPDKGIFLPDRFIKGECPKCKAKDQYGDNCEVCGAAYIPTDLIEPYSTVSSATLILKESDHFFFRLSDKRCVDFLRHWTQNDGHLQSEAANKMQEWLGEKSEKNNLSDWDISRDAPYFGFEIPNAPNKYFYVWLDAPIGYMGSFQNLCTQININFDEFWDKNSTTELYHFIGKDILYFHALFWPAMLKYSGYRTPTKIFSHGFLTVNGEKMSKSKGTFITAKNYINRGLDPECLRYYYAAKLNGTMEDIDLNLDDFIARVNSDLVGKYVNIASRAAGFLINHFDSKIADITSTQYSDPIELEKLKSNIHGLHYELLDKIELIQKYMESRRYNQAISTIMILTDKVNEFWDQQRPWEKAKQIKNTPAEFSMDHPIKISLHLISSIAIECFRILTILLKPILPMLAEKAELFLNIEPLQWSDLKKPLEPGHQIKKYEHLITRIDRKKIDAMIKASNKI
tara:strand:- start:7671 stop:9443 length:1773 start_codon:yes stop_codon:yes gene_type:complete